MHPLLAQIDISRDFAPAQKFDTLGKVVNLITANLFVGAGILLFVGIIYGGFLIMTKGSAPEELKKGQKTLTYSAFGFILVLLSYLVVKVIFGVLGMTSPL